MNQPAKEAKTTRDAQVSVSLELKKKDKSTRPTFQFRKTVQSMQVIIVL